MTSASDHRLFFFRFYDNAHPIRIVAVCVCKEKSRSQNCCSRQCYRQKSWLQYIIKCVPCCIIQLHISLLFGFLLMFYGGKREIDGVVGRRCDDRIEKNSGLSVCFFYFFIFPTPGFFVSQ
jgi:hypothetical protein